MNTQHSPSSSAPSASFLLMRDYNKHRHRKHVDQKNNILSYGGCSHEIIRVEIELTHTHTLFCLEVYNVRKTQQLQADISFSHRSTYTHTHTHTDRISRQAMDRILLQVRRNTPTLSRYLTKYTGSRGRKYDDFDHIL